MMSSFYLGSILKCDCLVKFFLGTPAAKQESHQNSEVKIKMADFNAKKPTVPSKNYLDPLAASPNITIDKVDGTVSGEGRVYGLLPISQSKLYFEVHVIRVGELRVGVGWKEKDHLDQPLTNSKAWTEEFSSFENYIEPGDVIVTVY
eukprot:TRINITY_DN10328_c0_g1_i3.p1 TRINITY_DN10328_c0_g1~~TRINITY_DN10328_c0_g1_i3.p1  ORF type:complete len:162 (-),score=37.70 TRINITY_DN10328_c0_g1_i3:376-816(-)